MSIRHALIFCMSISSESGFARCDYVFRSLYSETVRRKKTDVSNRCMYMRPMNNSRMCEFVRILRTRPRICYKHTPRDRFAGFVNRSVSQVVIKCARQIKYDSVTLDARYFRSSGYHPLSTRYDKFSTCVITYVENIC